MFVRLNYLFMIKTGILGTSETANLFAGALKESENFELTGCFSPDYTKSKLFASEHNLVAYPSAEAMFNYADALIITDFSPDFLINTEKSLKAFKHILITNPFLAGIEEIQHLRKLSEESGVLMQIAGGFKFKSILPTDCKSYYFADLKHTFSPNNNIYLSQKLLESLLYDISLLLILLKGVPKKVNNNAWDINGKSTDLLSARIELDNGNVANILLNQLTEKNSFILNLYGNEGLTTFESEFSGKEMGECDKCSVKHELAHFGKSIKNHNLDSVHNDIMFQALELAHNIKSKTSRNLAVNFPG